MAKDVDLFAAAMAAVKPLGERRARKIVIATPKAGTVSPKQPPMRPMAGSRPPRMAPVREPEIAPGDGAFDRAIDRSLSRGRLEPETKLDLHGLTLSEAERAVTRFLEQATQQECRVALVVTGKGTKQQDGRIVEGRIRSEFVGWLNRPDNRARVRAVRPAHPRHGGTGAFYVLLRRRSSASKRSLRDTPQR